jgi:hypothetical protein
MGPRKWTMAVIAIGLALTALLAGGLVPTATGAAARRTRSRAATARARAAASPYSRHRRSLGLVSTRYSVVRAFMEETWRGPRNESRLFPGTQARVDTHLGPWTLSVDDPRLEGLGSGLLVRYLGGSDYLYRDVRGVRLIIATRSRPDELILSAQCTYAGKLVRRDLRRLRTESGVGLGDSRRRVLARLGKPSRKDYFQGYGILWYLSKPRRVDEHDEGNVAAYVLKRGKVVEIWLHLWSNERIG